MIHNTYLFFVSMFSTFYLSYSLVLCTKMVKIKKLTNIITIHKCQHLLFFINTLTLQLYIKKILKSKINNNIIRNFL